MTAPGTPQTVNVADHAAPADPTAIEPKVIAATIASGASAATLLPFVLWLLGAVLFHGAAVPSQVQAFAGLVITGGCTLAAGYRARHVNRPAA